MATLKQKRAFKEITENNRSVSDGMRRVGYKKSTATKPKNLTNTKGWNELMEKYLPDKDLAKVHKEGLLAIKRSTSLTEPDQIDPDYPTRHKYLDTAYKLKGKYAPEKFEHEFKDFLTKEQTEELFKKHK
jgi:hypothetical protein